MKAAIICPTSMLEWVQKEFDPHFHFVLAQIYLEDKAYADFFLERRRLGDDMILDQGAAELGASIDDGSIMTVVRKLKPTIVVAPDIIYSSFETIIRVGNFLKAYADELKLLGVQIMVVPQGENNERYLECFSLLNCAVKVDWLGISRFYHDRFDGRARLLALIEDRVKKPCHLLGVGGGIYDLDEEVGFDFAKSVDTARPVRLGLDGFGLHAAIRLRPKQFFSSPAANLTLVKQNIEAYLKVTGV